MTLVKVLIAASMSEGVLRGKFRSKRSERRQKISQLVSLLQRLEWGVRREVSNDNVMRTGVGSEESSKQDLAST
jgi:hypothetical protein